MGVPPNIAAALLMLVVSVTPAGGQMQTLLLEFEDTVASGMGRAVCGAGDVDGDGHDDLALGEPLVDDPFENGGRVTIRSGKNGDVLFTLHGPAEGASFGSAVAPAGDIDGDGIPDLAVGAPGTSENGPGSGSVRICSGADGSTLLVLLGQAAGEHLGLSVACARDLDGQPGSDIVASTKWASTNGTDNGSVRAFSGQTGALLYTLSAGVPGEWFGESLAIAGDVDADGHSDIVVGAPMSDVLGPDWGAARVYSGIDGHLLHVVGEGGSGYSVSSAGDVDQDGHDDVTVLVGYPGWSWGRVYSGQSGLALLDLSPPDPSPSYFGVSVGRLDDVTGDGIDELLLGEQGHFPELGSLVTVFSGADGVPLYSIYPGPGGYPDPSFGDPVVGVGDVDADGYADVAIGANHAVKVYSGFKSPWWQYFAYDLWSTTSPPSRPVLAGHGTMQGDTVARLLLTESVAGAQGFLVLGWSQADVSFKGGTLFPSPDLVLPLVMDGRGEAVLEGRWPTGVPSGLVLWCHAWVADPTGPQGFLASNGLTGTAN